MCSPACQQDAPDRRPAAKAGQARAHVDAVFQLEEAPHAIRVHIVADRRPAQPDGVFENIAQGQPQAFEFHPGQAATEPARANGGAKEALVGVDVTHAGEQLLIEQGGFDGQAPWPEELGELLRRHLKRIGPWSAEAGTAAEIAELQPPKAARVNEAQFPAAGQAQPRMSVGWDGSIRGSDQQSAGHAEMDNPLRGRFALQRCHTVACVPHPHRVIVFAARVGPQVPVRRSQLADDVLSGAMDGQNRASFQPLGLPRRRCFEGLAVSAKPHFDDAVAAQSLVHPTSDGLDLRQFRHCTILVDMRQRPGKRGSSELKCGGSLAHGCVSGAFSVLELSPGRCGAGRLAGKTISRESDGLWLR